ncbi:hypothetical protein ISD37_14735, partial [Pseudomonas aeruginosa]|nr:hypothetical protein [Pseudomonas aeruginosa]
MSPLIELTKEHLTPLLHKLAVQALKNSPCPFAWMTQDSLWIDDAWLAASLNIKLNPVSHLRSSYITTVYADRNHLNCANREIPFHVFHFR